MLRIVISNLARRVMDGAERIALWAEQAPLAGDSILDRMRCRWMPTRVRRES